MKPTRAEAAEIDRQRHQLDGQADKIKSKPPSEAYREGWERVFGHRSWSSRKGVAHVRRSSRERTE